MAITKAFDAISDGTADTVTLDNGGGATTRPVDFLAAVASTFSGNAY